jgi:hypothetical protein
LVGDDDPGAGSVASSVGRWSYGRTEVERTAGSGSLVASSAAREGFAAAEARRRRYDVGGAEERTCGLACGPTGAAAAVSWRTVSLRVVFVDAGRRRHNLGRKSANTRSGK